MVRLRVPLGKMDAIAIDGFQFQDGAIKGAANFAIAYF